MSSTNLKTYSIADIRTGIGNIIDAVLNDQERVVITRRGRPAAILLPLSAYELLDRVEQRLDRLLNDVAVAGMNAEKTISWDDFKKVRRASRKKKEDEKDVTLDSATEG